MRVTRKTEQRLQIEALPGAVLQARARMCVRACEPAIITFRKAHFKCRENIESRVPGRSLGALFLERSLPDALLCGSTTCKSKDLIRSPVWKCSLALLCFALLGVYSLMMGTLAMTPRSLEACQLVSTRLASALGSHQRSSTLTRTQAPR